MKRLIIYDLDGTLADTLEDLTQAVNHTLRSLRAPELSREEVRGYVGRGVHDLIRSSLKTDEARRVDDGVAAFRAYYAQHLLDHTRLYPGASSLLDHFADRAQAVVTNKPDPFSQEILAALGVLRYFVAVIAGEAEFPKKPDPASVRALMARVQVHPEEALLVGDSAIDVETGRNAGIMTACVLHGLGGEAELRAARPDVLVRDFAELLAVARARAW